MTISHQKNIVRTQLLQVRNSISESEWREKSDRIHKRFNATFNQDGIGCIHIYIPMMERREVDTIPIITDFLDQNKRVVVPVTNFQDNSLLHSELLSINDVVPNKWGVMEPKVLREVHISDIDLIVVPLVAADIYKNRLGYGKGFYDRFLSGTEAPKVGFCFEDCLVDQLPVEEFDVPLDYVVTDKQVID